MNSVVEDTYFSGNSGLKCRDKLLDLSTPAVMGILNITPDSFYSGSRQSDLTGLMRNTEQMLIDGAKIIDIGGYSSRPGAIFVNEEKEIERLLPAIDLLKKNFPGALFSVDTFRSSVAEKVLDKGVEIINDISGFQFEPELINVVAKYNATYILMHLKGDFNSMHYEYIEADPIIELTNYFSERINVLHKAGISQIVLDPGFGFSKTMEQNFHLLNHLNELSLLNAPILAGISRKSMIYKSLNTSPEDALNGTTVLNTVALMRGAKILRVHDVKEAVEAINLCAKLQ